MANTWSFFPTANTVIVAALRRIRAYDPEDVSTISATQTANALETLNFLMGEFQTFGLQIWCRKQSTANAMVASQVSYTVGSGGNIAINRPMMITQAWLRETATGYDNPLNIISAEEYLDLSVKTQTGTPVSVWYDPEYDGATNTGATSKGKLYLWPAADAATASAKTLNFYYQRPLEDFDTEADAIDMPQEWFNALRLQLALAIAPEYGMQASDYDRLKAEAEQSLKRAKDWDAEQQSVTVAPAQD